MRLSRENGFYDVKGREVFVKKGVLYPDDDPAVKAIPSIFDKVSDDAPPKSTPRRVTPGTAPAASASKVKDDG